MSSLGPWELVDKKKRISFFADEGVMTVAEPTGKRRVRYRGGWSIPVRLRLGGRWVHIGDPDSHGGVIVDCYQGKAGADAKMYRVTQPDGSSSDFIHPLAGDEHMNNSFVAISPDGQWMVSGEWDVMRRLLVLPTPTLNTAASPAALPLATTIQLDKPVRNVQGGAFVDPVTLLCSTDDPDTALWPVARQLLQITLDRPLDGQVVDGRVTCLGALPLESPCSGTFEVEGIDYDDKSGELRVVVVPPSPCKWAGLTVYCYHRRDVPHR